ncbi:hypothetical protein GJ496_007403 [Pomphorhynchus laevis]|nr:hypothetical protein GJ496_007403 [Pomphorhynchus laevis]
MPLIVYDHFHRVIHKHGAGLGCAVAGSVNLSDICEAAVNLLKSNIRMIQKISRVAMPAVTSSLNRLLLTVVSDPLVEDAWLALLNFAKSVLRLSTPI